MTLEEEIRAEAKKKGVLPYFVEKEYLQHLFLSHLFKSEGFVLRGSACLRIAYGYERFPRSLELASHLSGEDVKKAVHMALEGMSIRADHSLLSERLHEGGYEAIVEFKGPLYYGASKNTNILTFSVEFRSPVLEPKRLKVAHAFVSEYGLWALEIREVLAEKLFSLALRKRPEDAYDAWSMLKRGVELDWGLVEKKASQKGRGFVKPSPPFCEREGYEKALRNVLPSYHSYQEVVTELRDLLEAPMRDTEIKIPHKKHSLSLVGVFFIGVFLAVSYYWVIHAGQQDNYTVLYFTNPSEPLVYHKAEAAIIVNFTVENHEARGINYTYAVSLYEQGTNKKVKNIQGRFFLKDKESKNISEKISLPSDPSDGRGYSKVAVELYIDEAKEAYREIWHSEFISP